ncbi:hypothetical protein UP15_17515 [Bacillus pumilus]|nr:hypothetical protein UP15_17515 [Bacillus pumilus]
MFIVFSNIFQLLKTFIGIAMYKDTDMFDHTNITLKNYKDLVFTRFKGVGLVLKIQFIDSINAQESPFYSISVSSL